MRCAHFASCNWQHRAWFTSSLGLWAVEDIASTFNVLPYWTWLTRVSLQGVALVVDAEVTSYLMMGALSPALKRHSVTLFEGACRLQGVQQVLQSCA